jgi:hypothetical protein
MRDLALRFTVRAIVTIVTTKAVRIVAPIAFAERSDACDEPPEVVDCPVEDEES